jgi:hypothetical protein
MGVSCLLYVVHRRCINNIRSLGLKYVLEDNSSEKAKNYSYDMKILLDVECSILMY